MNTPLSVPYKKLHHDAIEPTYGSAHAAGMDLCACLPDGAIALQPGRRQLIKTGLAMAIPTGFYGRIAPRSGLAYKNGIDVLAGVVDEDYRGDIGVILINLGTEQFVVDHGDRIAQLLIEPVARGNLLEVPQLPETNRGDGGFGSTGVKS